MMVVLLVISADNQHYDISTSTFSADCNDPGQVPAMMNGGRMRDT